MNQQRKKMLFVNYGGFFFTTNTFVPDNALAAFATLLEQNGVESEIWDYQNPETIERIAAQINLSLRERLVQSVTTQTRFDLHDLMSYQEARHKAEASLMESETARLIEKVASGEVGAIGYKLWVGASIVHVLKMAKAIKGAFPKVVQVAGGPAIQLLRSDFKEYCDCFDQLIYSDHETSLLTVAKFCCDSNIQVNPTSSARPASLDLWPLPHYGRRSYSNIDHFFRLRVVDDSRGCFNRCSFCAHRYLSGPRWQVRDPMRVVDHLEKLHFESGINYFRLAGSNPPWRFIRSMAQEIVKRNLKIRYAFFSSMNNVQIEDFALLASSGVRAIFWGIESGDEELGRQVLNKDNRSLAHIYEVVSTAMQQGIFAALSFIYPSPFETELSSERSLNLISALFSNERARQLGSVLITPPMLQPGSLWWEDPARYGIAFKEGWDQRRYLHNLFAKNFDGLLPKELIGEMGITINGQAMIPLLESCGRFGQQVAQLGVVTDVDDAGYMTALMGGITPAQFKSEMIATMLSARPGELMGLVQRINQASRQVAP